MYCMNCGTKMNETACVCPRCSYPTKLIKMPDAKAVLSVPSGNMGYVQTRQANGNVVLQPVGGMSAAAILGMVLGIVAVIALFCGGIPMFFLGIPSGILGSIASICGLCACEKHRKGGKAFAEFGMLCSLLSLTPLLYVIAYFLGLLN